MHWNISDLRSIGEEDNDLIGRVGLMAELLLKHQFRRWFFGDSIGFEGLLAATKVTSDTRWRAFAYGFMRSWAANPLPYRDFDFTAPGTVMCEVARSEGDQCLADAALAFGRHLDTRRRLRGAAITFADASACLRMPYSKSALSSEHNAIMEKPGPGIWLDCMHFDAPFYANLSKLDPSGSWAAKAVAEILAYRDILVDDETGLYRHFWLCDSSRAFIRGWGRGQGWALLGLIDVFSLLSASIRWTPRSRSVVRRQHRRATIGQ